MFATCRISRRWLLPVLAAGACVVVVTACGSSGHKPSGSSRGSSLLAFSECMRGHGVAGFPDPSGGGIHITGNSINPFSPAFKAAQASCRHLLPGGGPGSRLATEQQKQQLVATSECMRSHGVPDFPDPTTRPPSGPGGYSLVMGVASNLFLEVPNTINPNSPAFQQAAKACGFGFG